MKAVAYCRVSTNKTEQIDSLASQQKFFLEYSQKNNYELVNIYADEGKSGTKLKNRTQLIRLLSDAENGDFDIVLIKDVSRLARNTLDFLTSIRKLKSLKIRVIFVNYDQTSSDSSEFMLTMLSAIAQEESANTSKRVKFGKKQNAKQGRVPNLVYGYNKKSGDYFNLSINHYEASVVRRIFDLYTNKNIGAGKIARLLNEEGIRTKRGCKWSQTAISRILVNDIYTGTIINGKEEVEDFLTGKRKQKKEESWMVVRNEDIGIINKAIFDKAQEIMKTRQKVYDQSKRRISSKYPFSQLIVCKHCNSTFRRLVRSYKNTYITWVCNGRNSRGADYCSNTITVKEQILYDAICNYIITLLTSNPMYMETLLKEYKVRFQKKNEARTVVQEYRNLLKIRLKEKEKYIKMFTNEIITLKELKDMTIDINNDINYYQSLLNSVTSNQENCEQFKLDILCKQKKYNKAEEIKSTLKLDNMTNEMLKGFISEICVDKTGDIDIYIAKFSN